MENMAMSVIALVGMLRYRHHHSLAELHQALRDREIAIGERTVLNLLARYEELVSIHLADQERLHGILAQQKYIILALDGLRPDVGARQCCGSYVIASLEKFYSLVRS
jgi:hypothetical protein